MKIAPGSFDFAYFVNQTFGELPLLADDPVLALPLVKMI
jgi:hypothetical protein